MSRLRIGLVVLGVCMIAGAAAPAFAEPGSRTLYLVRHGFYDHDNEEDPYVGKALVPLGVAQARMTAHRLRALPVELSAIHSSTMTRARQTAYIVRDELGRDAISESRLLAECIPPTWREDIMEAYGPLEENEACRAKLDSAFARYFVPSSDGDLHEAVVCHGNVIRYFVTKALKVDTMAWLQMSVGNCSVTTIRIDPSGAMKVLGVGDMGHIPPNLQSGTTRDEPVLHIPEQ